MIDRRAILAEARDWIGTPYQHQASAKGAGCDCLGLIRGIWRAFYGVEPEVAPPYTPDWAEREGAETLLATARRHLHEIDLADAAPGDVLLFRMEPLAPVKHTALLDEGGLLIHAYWGRAVVHSRFAPWWRARCACAFSFPGVAPWRR
jgi:NlpC/P60 family putative phage cell wall peptidase